VGHGQAMGNGFQFIDIILFGMVAAFLVLRLRSVLGRRNGHEGRPSDPFLGRKREEQAGDNVVHLPDHTDGPADVEDEADDIADDVATTNDADLILANGISEIKKADRRFDLQEFLTGARMAFEMILTAFAAGNKDQLKGILSPEVFSNFEQAIREREASGEVLDDTLVGIRAADIVEAYLDGPAANVTVKFVSDQVSTVRNDKGDVIHGDPDRISEVTDFWTFARDTGARDPNWTLVATRSLD
jgi:predicted lipid-binding transport protein (Tim44 family)